MYRCDAEVNSVIILRIDYYFLIKFMKSIYTYIYVDDFIGSNYEHRFSFLFSFLFQCKNADETVEDRGGSAGVGIERRQAPENR